MTAASHGLGGRLPLVDPATLTGAGRELFDRIQATVVPWEKTAHRLVRALSTSHRVDDDLHHHATETFGAAGVFEIAALTGIYHTVCGVLNIFAIPAP